MEFVNCHLGPFGSRITAAACEAQQTLARAYRKFRGRPGLGAGTAAFDRHEKCPGCPRWVARGPVRPVYSDTCQCGEPAFQQGKCPECREKALRHGRPMGAAMIKLKAKEKAAATVAEYLRTNRP